MDAINTSITQLTGAVNNILQQLKSFETRVKLLESVPLQDSPAVADVANPVELRSPQNEAELKEISRLPDSVKELQVFDGNPTQYVSWVHAVENILRDFDVVKNKPIFRAILQHIRGKVRGPADAALVSYNIFDSDWSEIKKCLSLHYADKRDMRTLEHQLSQLSQKGSQLDEFYASVNHQLSLMVNKIKTESYTEETVKALVEAYRNRALDVFVRGLNGEISRMLIIQRPKTLPEAYSSCLEMQNLNYRSQNIHSSTGSNTITAPVNQSFRPNLPMRRFNPSFKPNHYPNRNYQSHFQPHSQPHSQPRDQTAPPKLGPKPLEKMDVDRSIQTRQVNYMNRPANNPFKRNAKSENFPNKHQRLFHLQDDEATRQEVETYLETAEDVLEDQVNFMKDAHPAYHI